MAENPEEIDDTDHKNYLQMLGEERTRADKIIGILSRPQLRTSHYNENGRNIYTSKITIVFFVLMICVIMTFGIMIF